MGFDADSTYTKPANKAIHAELAKLVSPEGMAELERLAKFLGQQSGPVTIESLPR